MEAPAIIHGPVLIIIRIGIAGKNNVVDRDSNDNNVRKREVGPGEENEKIKNTLRQVPRRMSSSYVGGLISREEKKRKGPPTLILSSPSDAILG